MTDKPNKKIIASSTSLRGKSLLGLDPDTATFENCDSSLRHLSEQHIGIELLDNGKWALVGDGSEESYMIAEFFKKSLGDGILQTLTPLARMASIINRLASHLDAFAPIKIPGVPSRMQALSLIQAESKIQR